jgi:uncharacterized protein
MAGPAAILREIHRLRAYAHDLQSKIDQAPKQAKAQQTVLAKREEELKQDQDAIKKLKVGIHEREVSVKAEHVLIKKYEKQLNDITSNKEYDALKHEIAAVNEKIRGLEEETLTTMMELEERTARLPVQEEAVKKAKAEFAEFERVHLGRLETWKQERDEATKQFMAEEAKLPGDIRPQYDRLIKAMGPEALSAVEGKNCTACYTELTVQLYHNVLKQQFVLCWNCGRVLYLKDVK